MSWEAGTFTSGGLYTGSLNRANKKIVKKSQAFCDAQGFDRWRFATLSEIASDDTLRAAWDIATGGTGKTHSTERTGNWFLGVEKHNRVRRILILSRFEGSAGPCRELKTPLAGQPKVAEAGHASEDDSTEPAEPAAELVVSTREAAEQGDAEAQNRFGEMHAQGSGVAKDYRQAVKWYRRAAEQGFGPAQLNLGMAYAEGLGVPNDHVHAHLWLNLASTSGDDQAKTSRDELAEKMTAEQVAEAQRLAREWWENQSE
ncbi:MAG: tetratricopeptide repeat protein [Acidobacteriota bacterium]